MKIFLAATNPVYTRYPELLNDCDYILDSFYALRKKDLPDYMKNCKMFLLDSGAFTFRQNAKKSVNWDKYIKDYIDFINKYDIQYFFELDIDSIVGYEKVKEYRKRIEEGTGKKCIPVWHLSRGKEDFLKMCDEYDYVAIGGIAGTDRRSKKQQNLIKAFPWFIKEAHKRGAKIHGLGCTSMSTLKRCHFDSVDSTSWLSGCKYGVAFQFNGKTMTTRNKKVNYRMSDPKQVDRNNFIEWCKFQQYAKSHL